MPNPIRLSPFLLSLAFLLPACADETTNEPTVTTDDRGAVIVEQDGYITITEKVPGGLVTEVRDAETHEDLALFEYDEESSTAVLENWDGGESYEVEIADVEPTLDTAHTFALASYERSQESFRKVIVGIGICCEWSYAWNCGYWWQPDDEEMLCCEWCTIYD